MTTNRRPCASCGTKGGYRPPGAANPERHSGIPYGLDGMICRACKRIRRGEKMAARRAEPWGEEQVDRAEIAERIIRLRCAKRAKYTSGCLESLTEAELRRKLPGEARR